MIRITMLDICPVGTNRPWHFLKWIFGLHQEFFFSLITVEKSWMEFEWVVPEVGQFLPSCMENDFFFNIIRKEKSWNGSCPRLTSFYRFKFFF